MHETDVLVIGSGIAGLAYALQLHELRPDTHITIVTKDRIQDASSTFAQGGIAAVTDFSNDSYENHIADTLAAGDGHCDRGVVEFVVREATGCVAGLARYGVRFDLAGDGLPDLAREGGHSARRILHAADHTGAEIMQKLAAVTKTIPQIEILESHFATDLICNNGVCYGAWMVQPGSDRATPVYARHTLIAAGGLGRVFAHTTNPPVATGDGIAMAWRAGAKVADMEFIQFHPTALWQEETGTSFLISEAVRGAGALLRNASGERFMVRYDPRLELATRDVVARAVQQEMSHTGSDRVYLDCTDITPTIFREHFPGILSRCLASGIDPRKDFIPVTPSAHYCCGGIVTDHHGRTSVGRLYAIGESACTGLHGGNRLASNSLLEALVFARRAAQHASQTLSVPDQTFNRPFITALSVVTPGTDHRREIRLLREKMSTAAIIIRDTPLNEAFEFVRSIRAAQPAASPGSLSAGSATYKNLLDVAWLILSAWRTRKNNCGAFFRERDAALA